MSAILNTVDENKQAWKERKVGDECWLYDHSEQVVVKVELVEKMENGFWLCSMIWYPSDAEYRRGMQAAVKTRIEHTEDLRDSLNDACDYEAQLYRDALYRRSQQWADNKEENKGWWLGVLRGRGFSFNDPAKINEATKGAVKESGDITVNGHTWTKPAPDLGQGGSDAL